MEEEEAYDNNEQGQGREDRGRGEMRKKKKIPKTGIVNILVVSTVCFPSSFVFLCIHCCSNF